jgi:hypothetical protein
MVAESLEVGDMGAHFLVPVMVVLMLSPSLDLNVFLKGGLRTLSGTPGKDSASAGLC